MPPIARLTDKEKAIVNALATFEYLTQAQLASLADAAVSAVSDILRRLRLYNYVEGFELLRPAAFRLTGAGYRLTDYPIPKKRSYAAIQHIVHTAQAFVMLRQFHNEACPLHRASLYSRGLYPSVGEHAADTSAGMFFLLIDDYLMRPGRLRDCWIRRHKPVGRFIDMRALRASGETLLHRWCDAASEYHVFTTDEYQLTRFESVSQKNDIPAKIHYMEPIWRLSK